MQTVYLETTVIGNIAGRFHPDPVVALLNNCLRLTMIPDPTTEIKQIRHQLGADADYDLSRIFHHLQQRQATSARHYVRLPIRKPADNHQESRTKATAATKFKFRGFRQAVSVKLKN